jgi:erythronate-4-phosphate dehydrogenase
MPYAAEFFSDLGNASSFEAGSLEPEHLVDVDVLLVRSTTIVNSHLLSMANRLSFVGTATAGYNHFDVEALESLNIQWASAGGCNAIAVAEYVLSAIYHLAHEDNFIPQEKTVAIVGAGNVGSALSKKLAALDIRYILYDPPLQEEQNRAPPSEQNLRSFSSFDEVMSADIICLHVPLVTAGKNPTLNLIGKKQLARLSSHQYLINACRGEVVDNQALLDAFDSGKQVNIVLDVWDNEPLIEHKLIPYCRFATAHIAGHTLEGKARGTSMLYDHLCALNNRARTLELTQFLPPFSDEMTLEATDTEFNQIFQLVKQMYDIKKDDGNFRSRMAKSEAFAELRKNYSVRREFSAATVHIRNMPQATEANKLSRNNKNASTHDKAAKVHSRKLNAEPRETLRIIKIVEKLGFLIAN